MEEQNIRKKIKCSNCEYSWETESKMMFVSCPSCLKKVKILEDENENKD